MAENLGSVAAIPQAAEVEEVSLAGDDHAGMDRKEAQVREGVVRPEDGRIRLRSYASTLRILIGMVRAQKEPKLASIAIIANTSII